MHIVIDHDDTVIDLCGGLQSVVWREFGYESVPLEAFVDKNWILPDGESLWGPNVLGHYLDDESWLRDRDWLWALFPAIPGALGAMRRLRREGHFLEIITKKPHWAEWITWKWFGRWRPPVNRITIMDLKDSAPKVSVTEGTFIIDDNPKYVEEFKAAGRDGIIFHGPWNYKYDGDLPVARNWFDVCDAIKKASLSVVA